MKTGIISKVNGEFYNNIFGFRQRSDYEDFVEFDIDKVKSWHRDATNFIASAEIIIKDLVDNK